MIVMPSCVNTLTVTRLICALLEMKYSLMRSFAMKPMKPSRPFCHDCSFLNELIDCLSLVQQKPHPLGLSPSSINHEAIKSLDASGGSVFLNFIRPVVLD